MPVLVFLADDDGHLFVLPQGNVTHQGSLVLNVVAIPVGRQVVVHVVQGFHIIGMVNIIHLFADVQVLVLGKRNLVVAIVGNEADVRIYNTNIHRRGSPSFLIHNS